jgi:hypothetical protein
MILVGQMILLVDGDEEQYITFRSMGKEAYLAGLTSGKDTDCLSVNRLIDETRRYLTPSLVNYSSEGNISNIALH